MCYHDSMEFSIVPLSDEAFEGSIYVNEQDDDDACVLEKVDMSWTKKLGFDDCGGAENTTNVSSINL